MLIPTKGRIIVKKIVEEKKEESLILPDNPLYQPFWAIVENTALDSEFDRHMKVLIRPYAGNKIIYDGKEFIILLEQDILCYIE
jgi:co-chaperonin GroES (HSP10)